MAERNQGGTPENVDQMLREVAKQSLTREEIRDQKVSFTMGMMGDKSTMTRREVEELVDQQYG